MAKPLDPLSLAAFEAMREVLSSHGLVICSASDTQFPKLGADLDKVLREMARNTTQSIIGVQDEQAHCPHDLVEVLALKPRSLDGARRVCVACSLDLGAIGQVAA